MITFPSLRKDTMFCDFKICSWCDTVVWFVESSAQMSFTHISQRQRQDMILSLVLSARFWKKSASNDTSFSLGKKLFILLQLLSLKSKNLFSTQSPFFLFIHIYCRSNLFAKQSYQTKEVPQTKIFVAFDIICGKKKYFVKGGKIWFLKISCLCFFFQSSQVQLTQTWTQTQTSCFSCFLLFLATILLVQIVLLVQVAIVAVQTAYFNKKKTP